MLALPIIGTLDSGRAARLTEGLLERIAESQAEVIILDISGVPTIDTQVAQHLLRTVQAATLMGAVSVALVTLGVIAFGLAAKYLPVFPDENEHHA